MGFALALLFGGGAAGKLLCGLVAERFGIVRTVVLTELATGVGFLTLLVLPLGPALALLPAVGIALNGTSSVLYGTVADFVSTERQSRAYGLFYTIGLGAGVVAPAVCGVISDAVGVPTAIGIVAIVVFTSLPLCQSLSRSIKTEDDL